MIVCCIARIRLKICHNHEIKVVLRFVEYVMTHFALENESTPGVEELVACLSFECDPRQYFVTCTSHR